MIKPAKANPENKAFTAPNISPNCPLFSESDIKNNKKVKAHTIITPKAQYLAILTIF